MAAREADVARVATTEQRRFNAVCATCGSLARAARVFEVVVDALRDEDQVCEAKVDGEGDDSRYESGPECASEVGDVANKPDSQEGEGNAIRGALFVVLNQLGNLEPVSWGGGQVACFQ